MNSLANVFKTHTPIPVFYKSASATAQSLNDECSLIAIEFDGDIEPLLLKGAEANEAFGTTLTIKSNQHVVKALKDLNTDQQIEVARLKMYIDAHWERLGKGVVGGIHERTKTIKQVQQTTFDTKHMSPATLARLLKGFNQDPNFLIHRVKGDKTRTRQSKINPTVRDKALEFIDDYYLNRQPLSRSLIHEKLVKELNDEGFENSQIPSKQTFYNWTKELDPLLVLSKQCGRKEFIKANRNAVSKITTSQILERVEVDAVHLACGIVDAQNNFLGSVTVFAVIDCYSRSILGIHVQVGRGETIASVLDSYKHAFLPKTADYGTLNKWTQFGTPQTLVNDGGSAYKSIEAQHFLIEATVSAIIAPTAQGWSKAFIERFFGTLRTRFAESLPGYCGRMNDIRRQEKSVKEEAVLTLEEFKSRLHKWIVDEYHQTPHRGLGNQTTPQMVWDEQARIYPPSVPANMEKMELPCGELLERTISGEHGHLGVVINKIRYNDRNARLKNLGLVLKQYGKKPIVQCNYNPNDISSISVVDPFTDEVFEVPSTESIPAGMPYIQFRSENKERFGTFGGNTPEPCTRTHSDTAHIKARQKELDALKRSDEVEVVSNEAILDLVESHKSESQSKASSKMSDSDTSNSTDMDANGGFEYE